MKILHLSSESSWRGGEQQIAYLIEELLSRGIENVIVCKRGSAFEAHCRLQGWPCYPLPLRNSLDLGSALALRRICRAEGVDLVHVHSSRGQSIAHLGGLPGGMPPLLLTRRVAFPIANKGLNVLRYNSARLRKIICVSHAVKAATSPVIRNKEALTVIYSGIDLSRFEKISSAESSLRHELGLPDNTSFIGTVAALTAEKDLSTFLRAARQISEKYPLMHFVVVGDGPDKVALQSLAAGLNLKEKVHFLGRRSNIPELIAQFSLFLFSSRQEGLGTSLLDAFACRVPVVSTAAGGIPEIVRHGETGLLAPIGDAEALATEALRLLGDQQLQQKLVRQAHVLLTSQFTKAHMAAQTFRTYQEVLEAQNQ
jgi:L-malate glycosyltransferase